MSTQTLRVSIPLPSRRGLTVAIVAALVGAGIALAVVLGFGVGTNDSPKSSSQPSVLHGTGFTVGAPSGWKALGAAERAKVAGNPVAVLQQRDGHGVVIVRSTKPATAPSLKALAKSLTADYKKRFPDFAFVSARVQRLRGGPAF